MHFWSEKIETPIEIIEIPLRLERGIQGNRKNPNGRTDGETQAPGLPPSLRARAGGKYAPFGGGRCPPHLTPINEADGD